MKNTRRKTLVTWALVVALVVIFALSFTLGSARSTGEEGFVGIDSSATSAIQEAHPGYRQWFTPLFEPASGEVESGLFALQAAIGGCVLGFAVGALWGRRRAERALGVQEGAADEHAGPPGPR